MAENLIKKLYKFIQSPIAYAKRIGVKLGEGTTVADKNHWSTEPYLIEIGENCRVAKGVCFFTHGAAMMGRIKYPDYDFFGKIKIGNHVYIGANSMIMPGVVVEDNVLIAAGSVVTKSVPQNSIVGGNPARIIGNVYDFVERNKRYNLNCKNLSQVEKKKLILKADSSMFVTKTFMRDE